mgnify:CR=1 FL=1
MTKEAKFVIIFLIIIYVLPIFITMAEDTSNPFDYARITELDYKGVILDEPDTGGKLHVTETLTFDIHAASEDNLFWELWRDLPEKTVDGLPITYEVLSVKEIQDDGTKIAWPESPQLYWYDSDYVDYPLGPGKWFHSEGPYDNYRNFECLLFYVDGIYRDEITFEIEYIINNATMRYYDVSELYLTMFEGNDTKYLKKFSGEILIKDEDMPKKGNYKFHTYGTNSNTFEFTESKTKNPGYHTFSWYLDENDLKFKPYNQYLELTFHSFGPESNKIANFAPRNYYTDDIYYEEAMQTQKDYDAVPQEYQIKKIKMFYGIILISIVITYITFTRDKRIRKKNTFYEPTQKIIYYRDIPSDLDPHFATTLVHTRIKKEADIGDSYSALLLNLVRKGYIELTKINPTENWDTNNISIDILYKPDHFYTTGTTSTTGNKMHNSMFTYSYIQKNDVITKAINPVPVTEPTQTPQPLFEQTRYNKKGKELENLSSNEASYFNLIVRHASKDTITMKEFQRRITLDYDRTDTFVTAVEQSIKNIGISKNYFQHSNYDKIKNSTILLANTYKFFAFVIIIIGNLILYNTRMDLAYGSLFILGIILLMCSKHLKKQANNYILFTQYGIDEYEKWNALYNFLNSETLMNEKTIIELPLWEKYLVYATAFGISEKVIKVLEIRCPDIQTTTSPILSNNYYRSSSFRHTTRSISRSTTSASRTSRSYSSGGYGGGRGGGGGGGGH